MGTNNKQRRAAKQRKRARQRAGTAGQSGAGRPQRPFPDSPFSDSTFAGSPFSDGPTWDAAAAYGVVELAVTTRVRRLSRRKVDDEDVRWQAESLLRQAHPAPALLVEEVLADVLARLTDGVVAGGWPPSDLAELVRRHAGSERLSMLGALLHEHARRHKRFGKEWLAAIDAVRPEVRLRLDGVEALASGLRMAALLSTAPILDADALQAHGQQSGAVPEHPKLAQVRALLAKAESTQFDEEAEALSAKAQELISRYALDRLTAQSHQQGRGDDLAVRRIWLDAPYVGAKAALVDEVASANRCRGAVAEGPGFCVLIGSGADLDAVELLVTSLLVQANAAMLRHGRRYDQVGRSRTRGFRKSFLMAYATGIGKRLRQANDEVASETKGGSLLPVLRDLEERVSERFTEVLPNTVQKTTNIPNGEGWYAGLAAADLALLDVNGQIADGESA